MRLVIKYVISDDCTYSCDETVPVEYSSAEAFLVEFLQAAEAAFLREESSFSFADKTFDLYSFFKRLQREDVGVFETSDVLYRAGWPFLRVSPEVLTLDEWFSQR